MTKTRLVLGWSFDRTQRAMGLIRSSSVGILSVVLLVAVGACKPEQKEPCPEPLGAHKRLITLLSTNDIHGHVEPDQLASGEPIGGMSFFAGVVKSIREGLGQKFNSSCAGVLLVDAGDQFQGTLISNYTEGELMFRTMNELAYDAVVPGNHDYDFGPKGWLDDKTTPNNPDQNPRSVIEGLAKQAKFPLLSANTYLKDSLRGEQGEKLNIEGMGCRVKGAGTVQWSQAQRPAFLKPYLIKSVAGVRVALIGLDNPGTNTSTTPENVSDLCFRDVVSSYQEIYQELSTQADVFVLIVHDGNTAEDQGLSKTVKSILQAGAKIDAVVSGHTHMIYNQNIDGVPVIQSGTGGTRFGRIDLIYDRDSKQVARGETLSAAGIGLRHRSCDEKTKSYCVPVSGDYPQYEGLQALPSASVQSLIHETQSLLAPVSSRVLGYVESDIKNNRTDESPLSDVMTDLLREVSGAEIAMLNTSGLRQPMTTGDLTYAELFEILPFNNHAVMMKGVTPEVLVSILSRSIKTCGLYGALIPSGLRVEFTKSCAGAGGQTDSGAKLKRVATLSGEVIYDGDLGSLVEASREFKVATLDFLASGGAGYSEFARAQVDQDLGVFREALTEKLVHEPGRWKAQMDGRWKNLTAN